MEIVGYDINPDKIREFNFFIPIKPRTYQTKKTQTEGEKNL